MASLKIFNSVLVFLAIMGTCGSTRLQFPGDNNSEDFISTSCSHTLYYQVCASTLRSDPRSKTADLQGLARIALNISKSYGVATVAHIGDLKSEATGNESLSSCLDECREEYSEAVENLEDVVEALNARSLENVKTLVSSAMTYSDTCEESFEEIQLASPLVDRNLYFSSDPRNRGPQQ
ncbi:hypothetical protein MANES_03G045700v8 [Manihot esculenta]|uniref:Uncharacterized protein n=2 Tax=Manihot esculenta TaxID=3983 RepID=A0ACB7HXB1_MANES|nr:hypothetical protein MANES_03G045700v8 [Manihot esculenta]KAG8657163.1 hypothetical protein MANES_03G045700v8 [Manihot esculenta]